MKGEKEMTVCPEIYELMKKMDKEAIPYEFDCEFGSLNVYEYFYITHNGHHYVICFPLLGLFSIADDIYGVIKTIADYKEKIREYV